MKLARGREKKTSSQDLMAWRLAWRCFSRERLGGVGPVPVLSLMAGSPESASSLMESWAA